MEELMECSLPTWYPTFQHITVKSEFIELSGDFLEYLTSDGIVLPQGCELPSFSSNQESDMEEWSGGGSEVLPRKEDDPDSPPDDVEVPSFPDIVHQISSSISLLGGRGVVPKLNWSSPRDAVWITATNSLCATSPAEVILLLKSSEFIAHDISLVSEYNSSGVMPPLLCTLCLRQWKNIPPSSEFRCFVRGHRVIGACQRECNTHYVFLLALREQILQELISFHHHQLLGKVTSANYVFDVYREKEDTYLLIDLNTFSSFTDPLLYSWEELEAWSAQPELRLIEGANCFQPSRHQAYRLPKDIVDLSSGEDIDKFVDLFQSKDLENA